MNVVLIGPSGAGKGTQTSRLVPTYGFEQISVGDMIRAGTAEPTTLGKMVKKYLDQGQLVRDEVVDALIKAKLLNWDYADGVIFDGFPRTEYQAKFLDELLSELGYTLDVVIYLDVTDAEIKERLKGRIVCRKCYTPYHEIYNPFTICTVCGSRQSYRREDDKPEIVEARLKDFHRLADPLVEYYYKTGQLAIVNGEGPISQVNQRLVNLLQAVERTEARPAMLEEVERIQALKDQSPVLTQAEATDSLDLVLLGGPGSGKGTQAEKLSKALALSHVSTGELFREHFKNNTPLGQLAKSYIERGELVPDDVTEGMVRERLSQPDVQQGFILDGFPRTIGQAEALTDMMTGMQRRLSGILYINVSDAEIVKRLSGRVTCQNCQTPFHTMYNPPTQEGLCDHCGGQLRRRDDDEPATVRARLRTYYGQTAPLISYYRALGLLYEIDGEGDVSDITRRIMDAVRLIEEKDRSLNHASIK
ncbi:MAG: adenylate kinase [Anaerolineaceae bacterium]|nr:adenylate kinase [Anaerolineaceae bacterium]